jgi:hypothetical protein
MITRLGLYGGPRQLYGGFSGKQPFAGGTLPGITVLGAIDPTGQSVKGEIAESGITVIGAISSGITLIGILTSDGQSVKGSIDSTGQTVTGEI